MLVNSMSSLLDRLKRRQFIAGASASALVPFSSKAKSSDFTSLKELPEIKSTQIDLHIEETTVNYSGRERTAICINQTIPGPILRVTEGDTVTIKVTNHLQEDTSIHWHGIILPYQMDGVPGLSFDGIKPGETFTYQFTLNQSGTYWYHSHSGYQEPLGVYGALIVEPREPYANNYDSERVVVLSDWSDEHPNKIFSKLKKQSHYYNTRERTIADLGREIKQKGIKQTFNERRMWNEMRMMDSDIADVTGKTYRYLINGNSLAIPWIDQYKKGERIRLRIINASSMTIFDVRIPELKMTVVAADGQEVQPVAVDEFRIGTAETYDVIIEPKNKAYTFFAQTIDRSGYIYATLSENLKAKATIPEMDHRPILTHSDMGMNHADHAEHSNHNTPTARTHAEHNHGMDHTEHSNHQHTSEHSSHNMVLGKAGEGSIAPVQHDNTELGSHVDMLAEMPQSGLRNPGIGLRHHHHIYGRRVLNYGDLRSVIPTRDKRQPSREIQLHLTGNMTRYMWSMNGVKFSDAEPLILNYGERVRIVLVNDTMMTHPIHLHGLWSELETGDAEFIPRKHTVLVQPGSTISYLVTADAEGRWAYHCHLLYHMAGMFREVRVSKDGNEMEDNHAHH